MERERESVCVCVNSNDREWRLSDDICIFVVIMTSVIGADTQSTKAFSRHVRKPE